jgi:cell division protein FtsW (lipid II flippase)
MPECFLSWLTSEIKKQERKRIFFIKPTFMYWFWLVLISLFHHLGNREVTVNKGIDVISNENMKMQLLSKQH